MQFNKRWQKPFVPLEKPIKEDSGKSPLPPASLIDTYSSRRRSTATCSLEDSNPNASTTKMSGHWPTKEPEHVDFHDINLRVENLRKRLEKTMNDLPNQSPRKSLDSENEKAELLLESRRLAGA
ncbi:unnamed protein product, partial [Gongylonema pulchrum]|uniref:Rb_C domain-containing protein n=1 Tax=Gongylonema pulchrum TaxID=637853 RepID=A0A183E5M4_9BILA